MAWSYLALTYSVTPNRYHHSVFIGHTIICENVTEKMKFPGTSVQWQNSDLAAPVRTVKESIFLG